MDSQAERDEWLVPSTVEPLDSHIWCERIPCPGYPKTVTVIKVHVAEDSTSRMVRIKLAYIVFVSAVRFVISHPTSSMCHW